MKKLLGALAAVSFLAFGLTSAQAATWTVTATGTVYADIYHSDQNGLFGDPGASLLGQSYVLTISTDPSLNTLVAETLPVYREYYGGPAFGGCCAAPYTISMTVGGVTYSQTELFPFINRSYLISGLGSGLASQDQVYQQADSSGCNVANGPCTSAYILAYSTQTPFVPSLDFAQTLLASSELDPASHVYFLFRNGPTGHGTVNQYTGVYGSISTLSVNPAPVPVPAALPLFAAGLSAMGFLGWRRRKAAVAG